MRRSFKKSTPDQIEEMKAMYKYGCGIFEIGRKLGRHHTTVLYHLGKLSSKKPQPEVMRDKRFKKKKAKIDLPKRDINLGKSYKEYLSTN